ncbi:MAG: hypothetical protein ACKVS6_15955 [Planctomycetota bacterium]
MLRPTTSKSAFSNIFSVSTGIITGPVAIIVTSAIIVTTVSLASNRPAGAQHKENSGASLATRGRDVKNSKASKRNVTKENAASPAKQLQNNPAPASTDPGVVTNNHAPGHTPPPETAGETLYLASQLSLPYIDFNPQVRAYCDITYGVAPGSPDWLKWGCALNPGQGGGQPDFGWRQDHVVPGQGHPGYEMAARAILANAGYRPIYYIDAPNGMRKGYGRPWDWIPDPAVDDIISTGYKAPDGKVIIGHDVQHFSLKFLNVIASNPVLTDETLAAKVFMWRFAAQIAGTLRTNYFQEKIHSSREVGRTCDFMVDCVTNSWMEDHDAQTFLDWVKNVVIPTIGPDGIAYIYKPGDDGYKPEPNLGAVPYWFPWQDGLMAAGMDRLGSVLIEKGSPLQKTLGGQIKAAARAVAIKMASVITNDGAVPKAVGLDGKLSWVENEKYGYGVWCYRALRIAGANVKADAVIKRYKNEPAWWSFLVEPNGEYNSELPMNSNR